MNAPPPIKSLIRWRQDGRSEYGIVSGAEQARVTVQVDGGSVHHFAWPSDVVERHRIGDGEYVRIVASDDIGIVAGTRQHDGLMLYQVRLASGATPLVPEDGVRPAALADPIERLRTGQFHDTRSTNLRLAATRLLYAHQHDELATLGNSRVELKEHQIGVVHRVSSTYPHRFVLADEVGLGKTVEAGLIVRELMAREVVSRVLVLAPSGLVSQWQQELKSKFNLSFSLYNGDSVRWLESENPSENVWALRDKVIASTSYATWTDERRREIVAAGWDMVIVDEAHHARRRWQGPGKYTSTRLYRLAEQLSDPDLGRAQAMLLLTATPMQLHRFELYSLVELLDPALFPTFEDFETHTSRLRGLNATVEKLNRWEALDTEEREGALASMERWLGHEPAVLTERADSDPGQLREELESKHRLSAVMVRNRKRSVGGFQPRVAAIWEVELTPEERAAYEAVTDYVQTGYDRSRLAKNNALGFLMATFQKLSVSSSHALRTSLIRRIEKLERKTEQDRRQAILEDYELEEMPTVEALDDLLSERVDADWEEVKELEGLLGLLDGIDLDSKTRVLAERLAEMAEDDPQAKVILFTQFRATQDYLSQRVGRPWSVHLFHGGMDSHEKDSAVARFRDGTGPQLLISTEAGGEGRNFQFCHLLVNYDLPWNPMKIEQRIGRVDRIGQRHPVTIFNFSTLDTIEERVVEVLTRRIGVFQDTIGGLDPILGDVEHDLGKIFMLARREADERLAEFERQLEARVARARDAEEKLADLIMDTRSFRRDEVQRLLKRPRSVSPDDIKRFVLGALSELRVRIARDEDTHGVYELRFGDDFERVFPDECKPGRTRRVTFDLGVALAMEEIDFMAFGHPIVDGLVDCVRRSDYGGITSRRVVLTDEVEPTRGWFFVYELTLSGLVTSRELFAVYVDEDGHRDLALGEWLLDRAMTGRRESFDDPAAVDITALDLAAEGAESEAIARMMSRRGDAEVTNMERLESERAKRQRFYDYRARAAAGKLEADSRTLKRLQASEDEDDRRILPVWQKRVEQAAWMVDHVEEERRRRLSELEGGEHVAVHHELLSASMVTIDADPAPLFDQVRAAVPADMFSAFQRMCRRLSREEAAGLAPRLRERRLKLRALGEKAPSTSDIGLDLADAVADALCAALEDIGALSSRELTLLTGAVDYFLLIDDESHDIKSPAGFKDDATIAAMVLEAIGRPDLRAAVVGALRA